jgi:hypothetical protein
MRNHQAMQNIRKQSVARITLSVMSLGSILLIYTGFTIASGVEVFSKGELPFGKPYDEWPSKFWNWTVSLTPEQSEPSNGSCAIIKSESMVMVFDPAIVGRHEFECDITSKDGIMIPSWNGVFENSNKDELPDNTPPEQLSKMAKEQLDLGAVTSDVKVDGKSVAKLDEITSMSPNNIVNTKVNTMDNFTEIFAKPFNLTIPENTYLPDQITGTWISGGHGWFTFLKPLPPGDHKVSYTLSVQGLGPTENVASENTYTFHVK